MTEREFATKVAHVLHREMEKRAFAGAFKIPVIRGSLGGVKRVATKARLPLKPVAGKTALPKMRATSSIKGIKALKTSKRKLKRLVKTPDVSLPKEAAVKIAIALRKPIREGETSQLLKNTATIAAGTAAGTAAGFPLRYLLRKAGRKGHLANLTPLITGGGGALAAYKLRKHKSARDREHWRLIEEAAKKAKKKKND